MSAKDETEKAPSIDVIARLLLWPGDAVARAVGVVEPDARMLLRLFVNLAIYAKVAAIFALLVA